MKKLSKKEIKKLNINQHNKAFEREKQEMQAYQIMRAEGLGDRYHEKVKNHIAIIGAMAMFALM